MFLQINYLLTTVYGTQFYLKAVEKLQYFETWRVSNFELSRHINLFKSAVKEQYAARLLSL